MSVLDQLASALGRRDEVPNIELAGRIVAAKDKAAIPELIAGLHHKNKDIQSDCVKVLYEVGEQLPAYISTYIPEFAALLTSKNNRLQWGAMTALNMIAAAEPAKVYAVLPQVMDAAAQGSVITKDNAVAILIRFLSVKEYASDAFVLLADMLKHCPTNQLPMYAENAAPVIAPGDKASFIAILTSRLDEIEKDTKRKRVEKLIAKMMKARN